MYDRYPVGLLDEMRAYLADEARATRHAQNVAKARRG